jgi:hypothetical protein
VPQPVAHPLFCWAIDKQRCVGVSATTYSISPAPCQRHC